MPVPFLLGAATLIGAAGHLTAKEKNKKAEQIIDSAKEMYNSEKEILESVQVKAKGALLNLAYKKKETLDSSMKQFCKVYERVKNIEINESIGVNEISKFIIDNEGVLQLQKMTNIYESTFSSGVTGAATGAVIALAASGSLPIVPGGLSIAGSALIAGQVGTAASIAGSALSFGVAMTPLAAVAAPAFLFTGISSTIKADENLVKAKTAYSEAEVAVEKMKTAETLCYAIEEKAKMYNDLLVEVNEMFAACTELLDRVTRKKVGLFKGKTIKPENITREEMKLISVTRALAGTVKAVIDMPILDSNGSLYEKAETSYYDTKNLIPKLQKDFIEVKEFDYKARPKADKKLNLENKQKTIKTVPEPIQVKKKKIVSNISPVKDAIRNLCSLIVSCFVFLCVLGYSYDGAIATITFSSVNLLIMNSYPVSKLFKVIKNLSCILLAIASCVLLYANMDDIIQINKFGVKIIIAITISVVMFFIAAAKEVEGNFAKILIRLSIIIFTFSVAIILYWILNIICMVLLNLLGIMLTKYAKIITMILFAISAIFGAYIAEIIDKGKSDEIN